MSGDFSELLRRAKAGDPAALDELVRRYQPSVMANVRRRLAPELRREFDTLDLGQSVVVDVLRDLPAFEDRGEVAFEGWLGLKARNKVTDKFRRRLRPAGGVREERLADDADFPDRAGPGAATRAGIDDERLLAKRLLDVLPPLDRRVVELRVDKGMAFEDVARETGLAGAEAARKRFVRAVLKMRTASKRAPE